DITRNSDNLASGRKTGTGTGSLDRLNDLAMAMERVDRTACITHEMPLHQADIRQFLSTGRCLLAPA
ncbi:hypothetical protein, partial [Roseovarius azorensis]|uniref:hypothetical protein n=1 Tax=Roseovarius azorensis TaxID=1287727 RepID=UPI001C319723